MVIPRFIPKDKIIGFVMCTYGPLPCENEDDIAILTHLSKIFDKAVIEKRITIKKGTLPVWNGALIDEREAHQQIQDHALMNLSNFTVQQVEDLIKINKKPQLSYLSREWVKKVYS